MRNLTRLLLTAASVAILSLTLGSSSAYADDPPPIDPTLDPGGAPGGTTTDPTPADWDVWWNNIIPLLEATYPEATYSELCEAALALFNLLPPETPPATGDGSPPPPDCDAPPPPITSDAPPTLIR